MDFCLLGSNGLDFGFRWVGFWILMGFGLDLDWLVGLAWWPVGCLVVFAMGLLVVWFWWDFGGQWWRGGDWVVWLLKE